MTETHVGTVGSLHRYPVKSMLGESPGDLAIGTRGVVGDRAWAVLDATTGKVGSAKRPKLWRALLGCGAHGMDGAVEVTLPDGTKSRAGEAGLNDRLSEIVGRAVRLVDVAPQQAELDRAHPEAVLDAGFDNDVAFDVLVLGAGAPPGTFLDYAPLHLITSATLDAITAALPDGAVEPARYRPNVVIHSPDHVSGFIENDWVGGILRIGQAVTLRLILQTPRCAIPTLPHGALPARPDALRVAARRNRVEIPGFGNQPCAGVYAEVLREGTIKEGDAVVLRTDS